MVANSDKLLVKLHDKYYDLTKFQEIHPGGHVSLKSGDITARFKSAPKHTDAAMYLLQSYKVDSDVAKEFVPLIDNEKFETDINNNADEIKEYDKKLGIAMDESMEHLVDWNKALLPQVWNMKEHYNDWVHRPVDRPFLFVQPQWLEELTKVDWWHVPLACIPVIMFIIHLGNNDPDLSYLTTFQKVLLIGSGLLTWSFIEYFIHRNVFHMDTTGNCQYKRTLHFLIHGIHHKVPFCNDRLLVPPLASFLIGLGLYNGFGLIMDRFQFFAAGLVCGYLAYEMMHYYCHFGRPSSEGHLYYMKRFHLAHHFSGVDIGFGVTSSFWDGIFETKLVLKKLKNVIKW